VNTDDNDAKSPHVLKLNDAEFAELSDRPVGDVGLKKELTEGHFFAAEYRRTHR
jgi:hypothetical protein